MQSGAALNTCRGSYLQVYISGRMIRTIPLNGYGTPVNPASVDIDCVIAILGTGATVLTLDGVGTFVALAASIYGLKTCTA
jgi:hypothetical protein